MATMRCRVESLRSLSTLWYPGLYETTRQKPGAASSVMPEPVDRELAAVVGQRMEHDGRVLPRLDDLVEVADRALAHRSGQRPVDPRRVAALEQEAPDEVGGGEVVVAGHGDERPLEVVGHRLDEPGLAAAGRALEQDRQALTERGLEHFAPRCRPARSTDGSDRSRRSPLDL